MEKEKFEFFINCVEKAFVEINEELIDYEFNRCNDLNEMTSQKVVVIVGMTGKNKGRILIEAEYQTALFITETMNYEPLSDETELYMFMGEYTNMLSGRATTYINNKFKGSEIRLTPPAIFCGEDIEINTPRIQSQTLCYQGKSGNLKIDIGFEGV